MGTTFPFHLSPNLFVISLRCGASYSSFLAAWPALHSFLCPLLSHRPPTLPILHPGKYSAGWLVFLRSVLSISSDRAYLKCLVVLSEISGSSIGFHPRLSAPAAHSMGTVCLSVAPSYAVSLSPDSSLARSSSLPPSNSFFRSVSFLLRGAMEGTSCRPLRKFHCLHHSRDRSFWPSRFQYRFPRILWAGSCAGGRSLLVTNLDIVISR